MKFKYSGVTLTTSTTLEIICVFCHRYNVVPPPVDESYGVLVNGSWNGLVGMVQRKVFLVLIFQKTYDSYNFEEADIAVAALTITKARKSVVDFSSPFSSESLGILIRIAEKEISIWNMILVFSKEVWLTILAATICAVFIIRMIFYLDRKITENNSSCTISYCMWLVYGGLLNQSMHCNV